MKIAVIGAGNGGQAISGYLALKGYEVSLYDIDEEKVNSIKNIGGVTLEGQLEGF